jgi:predicted dehydrogenase
MFRWGILGTGTVARKFVLGLAAASDMRAVVVASRSAVNARTFARDLGVATAAETYEAAAAADADAFYIATPPSEHARHALPCLARGKPVLIEKPFAASAADARAIIAAAAAANTFCMEAMWTRFLPLTRRLKALVAEGVLGEPRAMAGAFCGADVPSASKNLFNPALGGGALLHRGVYPLSLASHLFGPIAEVTGAARFGETGVDEDVALAVRHVNGALATVRASLRTTAPLDLVVSGTAGEVVVAPPIYRPFRMTLSPVQPRKGDGGGGKAGGGRFETLKEGALLQGAQQRLSGVVGLLRGRGKAFTEPYAGNGYHYQAEELRQAVASGQLESTVMPLAESLALVEMMERALRDLRR